MAKYRIFRSPKNPANANPDYDAFPWYVDNTGNLDDYGSFATHAEALAYVTGSRKTESE